MSPSVDFECVGVKTEAFRRPYWKGRGVTTLQPTRSENIIIYVPVHRVSERLFIKQDGKVDWTSCHPDCAGYLISLPCFGGIFAFGKFMGKSRLRNRSHGVESTPWDLKRFYPIYSAVGAKDRPGSLPLVFPAPEALSALASVGPTAESEHLHTKLQRASFVRRRRRGKTHEGSPVHRAGKKPPPPLFLSLDSPVDHPPSCCNLQLAAPKFLFDQGDFCRKNLVKFFFKLVDFFYIEILTWNLEKIYKKYKKLWRVTKYRFPLKVSHMPLRGFLSTGVYSPKPICQRSPSH